MGYLQQRCGVESVNGGMAHTGSKYSRIVYELAVGLVRLVEAVEIT